MSKLTIYGIPIGVIISVGIVLYLAFSDFQSSVEIIDEGQEVRESAEEQDSDEFNRDFSDWMINVVIPIIIVGAFIGAILSLFLKKGR